MIRIKTDLNADINFGTGIKAQKVFHVENGFYYFTIVIPFQNRTSTSNDSQIEDNCFGHMLHNNVFF